MLIVVKLYGCPGEYLRKEYLAVLAAATVAAPIAFYAAYTLILKL